MRRVSIRLNAFSNEFSIWYVANSITLKILQGEGSRVVITSLAGHTCVCLCVCVSLTEFRLPLHTFARKKELVLVEIMANPSKSVRFRCVGTHLWLLYEIYAMPPTHTHTYIHICMYCIYSRAIHFRELSERLFDIDRPSLFFLSRATPLARCLLSHRRIYIHMYVCVICLYKTSLCVRICVCIVARSTQLNAQ